MAKKDKITIDYFQHQEMLEAVKDLISQGVQAFWAIILLEYLESIQVDKDQAKKVPFTLSLMMAMALFHDRFENQSQNIMLFFAANRQKIDNTIFNKLNEIRYAGRNLQS